MAQAPAWSEKTIANSTGAYLALIAALEWCPATIGVARTVGRALAEALSAEPKTEDVAKGGELFSPRNHLHSG